MIHVNHKQNEHMDLAVNVAQHFSILTHLASSTTVVICAPFVCMQTHFHFRGLIFSFNNYISSQEKAATWKTTNTQIMLAASLYKEVQSATPNMDIWDLIQEHKHFIVVANKDTTTCLLEIIFKCQGFFHAQRYIDHILSAIR
ncbi:hypothetical protein ACJX0J_009308 [Zea mays]